MHQMRQGRKPNAQNREMQRMIKKKKPNANIILSVIFIALIIISFLVIFAINGQDADDVSGRPTLATGKPTASDTQEANPSPTPETSNKVVVIDPGHGGFDVGTLGSETMKNEDALNLAIALKVGNYLSQLGITPVYTRSDDGPVADNKDDDMQARVNIINSSNATLAISIHMNSYPADTSVKGPEVYYYDTNASTEESKKLASSMQSALNETCSGRRSYKAEDYMVLREANIPAILIECGFLSCPTEEAKLNDAAYQDKLAQAIANCIFQSMS